MACRDYLTLYQRPFTILRYGIPYGPRMRENTVLASFFRRALDGEPLRIDGDGRQLRNFVYVTDLARAHVLALRPEAENLIVNVDGPEPVSIRRLAELTRELVPSVSVEFGPVAPGRPRPARGRQRSGPRGPRLGARGRHRRRRAPDVRVVRRRSRRGGRRLARGRRWLTTPDASPSSRPTTRRRRSPRSSPACTRWSTSSSWSTTGRPTGTRAEISAWLPAGGHARMLSFDRNRGMSAAYYLAFTDLRRRLQEGELNEDDLIFTVDADGQHELAAFNELRAHHAGGAARRAARPAGPDDLPPLQAARQPADELLGHAVGQRRAAARRGVRLPGVPLGPLAEALDYYRGYRYSETVEVAIVMSRLGHAVSNDVLVHRPGLPVPHADEGRRDRPRRHPARRAAVARRVARPEVRSASAAARGSPRRC